MGDAISIRNLNKSFGPKKAVRDISLSIREGSLCGLIGPNGAGKTTTIRMIMSIIFPDSGEVNVLGKASAVESKDRIGYLPEERGTYRKWKVGVFLNYIGRLKGVDAAGLDQKVKQWLVKVGLQDVYKKKCEELSKGMQQKVQFIASVLHEPDLIILDEPFSGLDPVNRVLLRTLINEQHQKGRTIIFSTHAMYEAEQLCDHLLMIHDGQKVLDLSMQELYRKYDPKTLIVEPADAGEQERVLGSLRHLSGVDSARLTGETIELKLHEGTDASSVIAAAASACRVRRMELKRASVEEIFIEIVKGSGGSGEELEELRASLAQARLDTGEARDSA
ncbi:MAG: ATP-binding cassette domain-containing protein [Planctomycetes bacterium]|nr:ATP-binding cassette domain-containing protein [Planctomycetota bacterium]